MENNGKGIFYGVIGVATLIVAIIGATFAFFTATNTNTGTVTGTAATAGLDLTVTPKAPTDTEAVVMVPQLTSTLNQATTGTADGGKGSCLDANNNNVCRIYEITIANQGSSAVTLTGTITFSVKNSGDKMESLAWSVSNSQTNGYANSYGAKTTEGNLYVTGEGKSLTPSSNLLDATIDTDATTEAGIITLQPTGVDGASKTFYLVVYIEESNKAQNSTDVGTFVGTVSFNSATGGVTSTFTTTA